MIIRAHQPGGIPPDEEGPGIRNPTVPEPRHAPAPKEPVRVPEKVPEKTH